MKKTIRQPYSYRFIKASVAILDFFLVFASFGVAYHMRMGTPLVNLFSQNMIWVMVMIVMTHLYVFGSYDVTGEDGIQKVIGRHILGLVAAALSVIFIVYLFGEARRGLLGRGVLAGTFVVFVLMSSWYRYFTWKWLRTRARKLRWLVVTTLDQALIFWKELLKNGFWGQIHFLVEKKTEGSAFTQLIEEYKIPIEGSWQEFDEVVDRHQWSSFVVAAQKPLPAVVTQGLMNLRLTGFRVWDLSDFYERYWKKVPLYYLQDNWFFLSDGFQLMHNPIGLRIKRLLDLFASTFLLILAWPFMLLTAIFIRIETKGPALFKQVRTGLDGNTFVIYKFRSMVSDAEKNGAQWAVQNDSRITKFGKFIRLTRLDELPQLFNVIKGDMSFIGPRPERPEFNEKLEKEIPYYQSRHLVRPGITGWAQILYPYGASVEDATEKLQYELYYIKNYTLLMDVIIILKTISVVLFGRGR